MFQAIVFRIGNREPETCWKFTKKSNGVGIELDSIQLVENRNIKKLVLEVYIKTSNVLLTTTTTHTFFSYE